MLSIERQFVRTERPLYGHLVSLLENAIAAAANGERAVGGLTSARSASLAALANPALG